LRIKILILISLIVATLFSTQVDLVFGTCEDLENLPISQEQRDAICNRMRFGGGFQSVFDLLELGVFTTEEFAQLKPLVSIGKVTQEQSALQRIDSLYFRIGDWIGGESVDDEVVDEWIDAIRERPVISELGYRDLVSLQNVDPTDAIALLQHRTDVGTIKDRRQLRSINGLSARGYVSVRSYIGYGEPRPINWLTGGYAQARFGGESGENEPYSTMKVRLDNGPLSEGIRFSRNDGDTLKNDEWANPMSYPDLKFFVGLSRHQVGPVWIRRIVLGDYSAGFGEGVTFESGDYFTSRRSGIGFDSRRLGVFPDLSASQTYAMRGAAFELGIGPLEPTFFISHREKDAILLVDTTEFSIDTIVVEDTIFAIDTNLVADTSAFADLVSGISNWEQKVKETVIGGDLTVSPLLNLRLGITGYRANYNIPWDLQPGAIIDPEYVFGGDSPKTTDVDAELFNATYRQDFRSAIGVHGLWTIGNLALSAEYSEVVRDSNITLNWHASGVIDTIIGDKTSPLPIGDDPYGIVAKAQLVTNRVNIVGLYRHYDLGFDNPYNRGFSEYARYKGSLVEDYYRLSDESLVALAEENPRPMAEDGYYLEVYARPFRQLATTVEYDAFRRLSDMADYRRIVLKANYYPNSNLSFRLWRKWQGRGEHNSLAPTSFTVDEIRLTGETRLSGYSRLGFTVIHSYLGNPPRPRFYEFADPLTDDYPTEGGVMDISDGLMLNTEINASDHLNVSGQAIVYKGWLWNFEDNEFAELESVTDAFRWWVAVKDRLVNNLSVTFKLTMDTPLTTSNLDARSSYDSESVIEGSRVHETRAWWRVQLDYFF